LKRATRQIDCRPLLAVICGPTAVGKTALALDLAERFKMEVVSADSRQVYRGMDIGTAKPTPEEQKRVRHHLIDVVQPDEDFHASRYAAMASSAVRDILTRHARPLLVGGTGLYIKVLTQGLIRAPGADNAIRARLHDWARTEGRQALYLRLTEVDPETAKRLHPNDLVRIVRALEVYELTGRTLSNFQKEHAFREQPYQTVTIGLNLERECLYERINRRAESMFAQGLVEETEHLLAQGYSPELKTMQTIGYTQAVAVLQGRMTVQDAIEDLQRVTRRYAKQQITWFRQEKSIIWVDSSGDFATIRALIDNFYAHL
jgi:tRNA dimethylallyltransferase